MIESVSPLHLRAHLSDDEIARRRELHGLTEARLALLVAYRDLMNDKLEGISVDKMILMKFRLGLSTEVRTVKSKKKPKAA